MSLLADHRFPITHVAKFYVRVRSIRRGLEHTTSSFDVPLLFSRSCMEYILILCFQSIYKRWEVDIAVPIIGIGWNFVLPTSPYFTSMAVKVV